MKSCMMVLLFVFGGGEGMHAQGGGGKILKCCLLMFCIGGHSAEFIEDSQEDASLERLEEGFSPTQEMTLFDFDLFIEDLFCEGCVLEGEKTSFLGDKEVLSEDEVPAPRFIEQDAEEVRERALLESPQQPLQVPLEKPNFRDPHLMEEELRNFWFFVSISGIAIFFVFFANFLILCEYCHRKKSVKDWRARSGEALKEYDWFLYAWYGKCFRLYFLDDEPFCDKIECFNCLDVCNECCCCNYDHMVELQGVYVAPSSASDGRYIKYYYKNGVEL